MTMTIIWTGMVTVSILCGLATGRGELVAAAAMEGTRSAVELALSIGGMLCLWTGVMEVMARTGGGVGAGAKMVMGAGVVIKNIGGAGAVFVLAVIAPAGRCCAWGRGRWR